MPAEEWHYHQHIDPLVSEAGIPSPDHNLITESEGPQSVVQSDEICLWPDIVSIPLPDCRAKFLSDS